MLWIKSVRKGMNRILLISAAVYFKCKYYCNKANIENDSINQNMSTKFPKVSIKKYEFLKCWYINSYLRSFFFKTNDLFLGVERINKQDPECKTKDSSVFFCFTDCFIEICMPIYILIIILLYLTCSNIGHVHSYTVTSILLITPSLCVSSYFLSIT